MADSIGGAGPAPDREYVDHNAWVACQYDPAAWAAFDEQEMEWVQRAGRRRFQVAGGLALAEMALLIIGVPHAGWAVVPLAGVVGILIVAVGGIEHRLRLGRVQQRRQARAAGPREIRIGARGLIEAGCYTPLVAAHLRPRGVQIRAGTPDVLEFALDRGRGRGRRRVLLRVPIPRGGAVEAAAFVARFTTEVIAAYDLRWRWLGGIPQGLRTAPDVPAGTLADKFPAPLGLPAGAPTRRLTRAWVGGSPQAQRYGWGALPTPTADGAAVPDHKTTHLPPVE
jgi:hypothetical protein